jgi:hypothetical protein
MHDTYDTGAGTAVVANEPGDEWSGALVAAGQQCPAIRKQPDVANDRCGAEVRRQVHPRGAGLSE